MAKLDNPRSDATAADQALFVKGSKDGEVVAGSHNLTNQSRRGAGADKTNWPYKPDSK